MRPFLFAAVVTIAGLPATRAADVVINEIFYHSPADLEDLEYIELFNAGEREVDLSGWKFTDGIDFTFPEGAGIEPGQFLVLCKSPELLKEFYGVDASGTFASSLDNGGEKLTLVDRDGDVVDSVDYEDRAPWPVAADGYSASIERICPTAPGSIPWNWAPSMLSDDYESIPSGTPGQPNSTHFDSLPPAISSVTVSPTVARPAEPIRVEALVGGSSPLRQVVLLYRVVEPGQAGEEQTVDMQLQAGGTHVATIPGPESQRIVRLRIRATDARGATRYHPHPNEIRPAISVYVSEPIEVGMIPVAHFVNVGAEEFRQAREYREVGGRGRGRDRFGGFRGRRGFRRGGFGEPESADPLKPQGGSAFIYIDARTKRPELFDFVNITRRPGGFKVRLHKDRPLEDMTIVNVLYEWDERSILTEALAYELYRRAGNAAPRAHYLRLSIDNQLVGYHLAFEQPNRAFLRRNEIDPDGNLYKIIWQGYHRPSPRTPGDKMPRRMDIVGRHEKKTHPHEGYADLVALIEKLEETEDDEALWTLIRERFDVRQVINYFAVNMLLSHWDGFFNNYFLYHDSDGSGKWMLFPWDQDSTWGHRMNRGDEVFYQMPLTFGMEGDVPPGAERDGGGFDGRQDRGDRGERDGRGDRDDRARRRGGRGFGGFGGFRGGGARWWRPGGEISRPLLANPQFRKRFLARLKTLAEEVYTEGVFGPLIDDLRGRLEPEVKLRARLADRDEADAVRELDDSLAFFREHLIKRRQWILEQLAADEGESASPATTEAAR